MMSIERFSVFKGSLDFWNHRYKDRVKIASEGIQIVEFKAQVLNAFIGEYKVSSVIDFGCGNGNLISKLILPLYIGLDISKDALNLCKVKFKDDTSKSFFLYHPQYFIDAFGIFRAEMAMSIEVIFHLVEDDLFGLHMEHLFGASDRFVVIYSSNKNELDKWPAVRHRKFTDWIEGSKLGWKLIGEVPNKYPKRSFSDFYFYEKC